MKEYENSLAGLHVIKASDEHYKKARNGSLPVIELYVDEKKSLGNTYLINSEKEKKLLVCIGNEESKINVEDARKSSVNAMFISQHLNSEELMLSINIKDKVVYNKVLNAFIEGCILASFSFGDSFGEDKESGKQDKGKQNKMGKQEKKTRLKTLYVPSYDEKLERTIKVAMCQNYARKLANMPANIGTPEFFAKEAREIANKYGLKFVLWDKKMLEKKGLNLALAVNSGSDRGVYLVHLSYKSKGAKKHFAVVGKGICFDSGGLGIKPAKSMANMHLDKSGACACFGIIKCCAMLKINANVDAVCIFTENLISGKASKPSSIIKSYAGKTVELLHTDAEGRLILADAMAYVTKHIKPDYIIDLATLTGAMLTTLGDKAIGLFTNNYELERALIKAGHETYERVWPMPMFKEYDEMIKSDVADIKNLGSWEGYASSITGAKFIEAFVDGHAWAHLDIASMMEASWLPYIGKRGSGCGVRLVFKAMEHLINNDF
ncbi:MAG: leucyl aminopeptidase family protein [Candidatus Anstonellales archaeon]